MLRAANLAVRFLLELGALGAIAYWGATVRAGAPVRAALAVVLPATAAAVWGTFISPKAPVRSGVAGRGVLGLVVFAVAAAALEARGHLRLAGAYLLLAVISSTLFVTLRSGRE
jgi:hypothetical protein